jgi:hypothetical protein
MRGPVGMGLGWWFRVRAITKTVEDDQGDQGEENG